MAENRDSPDDLYPFAQALVRKLVWRHQLTWDKHRREDAEQDLFLAGWQVWQETQDIVLAKNRMASRKYNPLRDSWRSSPTVPTARRSMASISLVPLSNFLTTATQ